MKLAAWGFSLLIGCVAFAETYTCSYPGYFGKKLIIQIIKIDGNTAVVDKENYSVIQNTKLDVVLVRSFAEYNQGTKDDDCLV